MNKYTTESADSLFIKKCQSKIKRLYVADARPYRERETAKSLRKFRKTMCHDIGFWKGLLSPKNINTCTSIVCSRWQFMT